MRRSTAAICSVLWFVAIGPIADRGVDGRATASARRLPVVEAGGHGIGR